MKNFPPSIAFKYPWRAYQKEVLDQLSLHLKDNKLHLVAPPGSGKTVLGLEVILRLNRPTLILAPTLAVKNQWLDRFRSLFLQVDTLPDWVSTQLTHPKFLTVSTYQGLHAAFNYLREDEWGDEEMPLDESTGYANAHAEEVLTRLHQVGIQTLLVDEVHHLRKEWWKALDLLDNKLKPTIVGLTATPPYGAANLEWQRYMALAGPVDEEITVPTLLEVGDLCPHHDFIFYSTPLAGEREQILAHKAAVYDFYTAWRTHPKLAETLSQLPVFLHPMQHLDWIYENLTTYVAGLVFLKDYNQELPPVHFDVLGLTKDEIPALDLIWFEKMLHFYCFQGRDLLEEVPAYAACREVLTKELRKQGLIAYRQVQLTQDNRGDDLLLSSLSKLESIAKIVTFEYGELGTALRMAILTDYIRKEYYTTQEAPPAVLNKLGVLSIFETLRRKEIHQLSMAVLTGSVVLVPVTCLPSLQRKAGGVTLTYTPLAYDSAYVSLQLTSAQQAYVVQWITELVEAGEIHVLIGTKALLGEGWDAPSINSLIMASSIGAYITSNQVRGRAFRIHPAVPDKTAHIWHLVCLDDQAREGGKDWDVIHRRFQTFVGISNSEREEEIIISNGIERLEENNKRKKGGTPQHVEELNQRTLHLAKQRHTLKERWLSALAKGDHLGEGVSVRFSSVKAKRNPKQAKQYYTNKTIVSVLVSLVCSAVFFFVYQLVGLGTGILLRGFSLWSLAFWMFQTFVVGLGLRFGWRGWKYYGMYRQFGDIRQEVQQIGEALLATLTHFDLVTSSGESMRIVSQLEVGGGVFCALEGATLRDSHVFASCLHEILAPIENPRYVMERKTLLPIQDSESDFHAIPECIGVNRARVNFFAQQWSKRVGRNRIVYTRTPEGRRTLMHARSFALVNQLKEPSVQQEHLWL